MISNGTTYDDHTPSEVIEIINHFMGNRGVRLRFHYGDSVTGRAWGDSETGYLGRSMGTEKIPLLCSNVRSYGGGGILTGCVVKIEYANKKNGGVLYQHSRYHKDL